MLGSIHPAISMLALQLTTIAAACGGVEVHRAFSTRLERVAEPSGQTTIEAIFQDAAGFRWFSTGSRLQRYDGRSFVETSLHPDGESAFLGAMSTQVLRDGRVLLGTLRGLYVLDTHSGKLEEYAVPNEVSTLSPVTAIEEPAPGVIAATIASTIVIVAENTRVAVELPGGLRASTLATRHGRGLVACAKDGAVFSIGLDGTVVPFSSAVVNGALQLLELDDRTVLAATRRGLVEIEEGGSEPRPIRWGPSIPQSGCTLYRDPHGLIWIASSAGGLWYYAPGQDSAFPAIAVEVTTARDIVVRSLFTDSSGILWLGTGEGLFRIVGSPLFLECQKRFEDDGADLGPVGPLFRDAAANLWIGTGAHGVVFQARREATAVRFDHPIRVGGETPYSLGDRILGIGEPTIGEIWVGSATGILRRYDAAGDETLAIDVQRGPANPDEYPYLTNFATWEGRMIATSESGVGIVDPDARALVPHPDEKTADLRISFARLVVTPRLGGVAIAGDRLWIWKDPSLSPQPLDVADAVIDTRARIALANDGNALLLDASGRVGQVTESGISWLATVPDSLDSNRVFLLQDELGAIWVATPGALLEFRPSDRTWIDHSPVVIARRLRMRFGQPYRDRDGAFLLPCENGVARFDPRIRNDRDLPPTLSITQLQVGARDIHPSLIPTDLPLVIAHDQRRVELHVALLEFIEPSSHTFEYRILSDDEATADWISTRSPKIVLASLDPGTRTLEIRGRAANGRISKTVAIPFFVEMPLMLDPRFRFAVFAIALMIVGFASSAMGRYRERRRREREEMELRMLQAERLESLGVLAGGMAHDFNNLLTCVLGHADMAGADLSPIHPAQRNLDVLRSAAQRASGLTRKLLEYAGRRGGEPSVTSLAEILVEMEPLLTAVAPAKIKVEVKGTDRAVAARIDRTQVEQIVLNLVMNAAQAIGAQQGFIQVSIDERDLAAGFLGRAALGSDLAPGRYALLIVRDDGPGIAPEVLSRLFDPYFSTKGSGRGLGLASVLGIVKRCCGGIHVETDLGHGTTFSIFFPAMRTSPVHERPNAEVGSSQRPELDPFPQGSQHER